MPWPLLSQFKSDGDDETFCDCACPVINCTRHALIITNFEWPLNTGGADGNDNGTDDDDDNDNDKDDGDDNDNGKDDDDDENDDEM